jgi:hypothetical protein
MATMYENLCAFNFFISLHINLTNNTEGGGFFQRKEPPPGRPKGTVKAVWQKTGMAIKKKKKKQSRLVL